MLRFRMLGEVGVTSGDRLVDIGHARQQTVLTVLLLEVNRVVSADTLIDRVWGDRLPRRPRDTLYGYLSRLRTGVPISRRHGGYVITADPMCVDVHRFRLLADEGRATEGDPAALAAFDEALGLWRGEPFSGLESAWLSEVRADLARQRQAVELDRNDILLRLGRHAQVIADAPAGAVTNERLAGQVMLALHRDGRQADALRYFERARARLAEELGVDPSPDLRDVQYQVLSAGAPRGAPRQLPASPPSFTGRARELAGLTDLLAASPVVVITGGGGTGKTWLALRWAQDNVDRFPDGQLYVNLRGFDPAGDPVPTATALRDLLAAFVTDPRVLPGGLEAQTALYRSTIATRRMLIILDNARDTTQVAPLLPGSASCTVLVTSRNQLTGLVSAHGATPVALSLLTDAEATDLLTRRLGHRRMAAEADAAREITRHCAGLPLALGIAAARAAATQTLVQLADELREARLDALDTDEPAANLRSVFSLSYNALDDDAARTFRLLAVAHGADVSLRAATHLIAAGNTPQLLRRLTGAHLVEEHRPGRFRMHDLIRRYATELARDEDSVSGLTNYYLHAASAAMDQFSPWESYRRPTVADPVRPAPDFVSVEQAREWLDAERHNLVTVRAVAGTGRLAMILYRYLDVGAYYQDALDLHTNALAATSPDQPEHGYAHLHRGNALAYLGREAEAHTHYEEALHQALAHRDTVLETCAITSLAQSYEEQHEYEKALECYQHALELAHRHGYRHREGVAMNNLGDFYRIVGRYDDAVDVLNHSLAVAWELKEPGLIAYALANLGDVHISLGQHEKAVKYLKQALDLAREMGHRGLEVTVLNLLGKAANSPGYHRQALILAREVGARIEEVHAQEGLSQLQAPPHGWSATADER